MGYVALQRLKHSKTGEYIEPGSSVDLSHLSYDQIEMLKARAAVAEVEDAPPPQEAQAQDTPRTRRTTSTSEAEG